jgi:lysophospholipase L1-like esterase
MNLRTIIVATSLMLASLGASAANRYVVLSDSIFTQAYGTTRPSKMAFNLVNTRIDAIVHVIGSPGATVAPQGGHLGAADMLDAIEFISGRGGMNGVFIQVSTNDHGLGVPLETYKSSLRTLVSGIQSKGLGVMCIKPIWKISQDVPNAVGLTLSHYQQAMTDVCAEYGVATLTFSASAADFVDGLHLNETGHGKFAEWFINVGVYLRGWTRI